MIRTTLSSQDILVYSGVYPGSQDILESETTLSFVSKHKIFFLQLKVTFRHSSSGACLALALFFQGSSLFPFSVGEA